MTITDTGTEAAPETVAPPVAEGTQDAAAELAAFKRHLRATAIRVAKERNWCDPGLNEVLSDLGLPSKGAFTAFVKVRTYTERFISVPIPEAESNDEIAEYLDTERVQEAYRTTVSRTGTVASWEPLTWPRFDFQVGDQDLTVQSLAGARRTIAMCERPHDGWYCTRERGHVGNHAAGDSARIAHVWDNRLTGAQPADAERPADIRYDS
jgi:hypothetical protein